jgi:hypothetical protein
MAKASELYVDVPAGKYLFREGEAGSEMYIVESGSIAILRAARGNEPLAVLEAGDFLGEMAVLEDQPRFASAVAKTDCRLLRIERAAFAELLRQNVEIAVRIMRKLALRQRRAEQRVSELQQELARLRSGVGQVVAPVVASPGAAAPSAPPPVVVAPVAAQPTPVPPAAPSSSAASPPTLLHPGSGQRFTLDATRDEFLIGRVDPVTGITPEINLGPLDVARSLSRRHAKLLRQGAEFFVREEVGTANGTFVNGQRIATGTAVAIKAGDRLRFGTIDIELVAS